MNDKEQIEIQRKCKRPCNKCKVISNKTQQQKENDVHAKKASFKTEDIQTSSEITLKMNESKLTLLNPKTSEVATKISGEPKNQADEVLPKKETAPIESVEIILEDKLSMSEAVEDTDMENAEKDSIKKKSEGKIDMKFDVKKEEYEDLSMDIHKRFHKIWDIASSPNYQESHLVLATQYLVDDLPIELFEVLASLIEEVTKKPVVILHQRLPGRRIASELVDIAVMPPDENWRCGELLPASFVFEHDRNKDNTPHIYAEIIVAKDRPSHIKSIMDLRGCICAMTRKHNSFSAAGLLLDELRSKGENINFFSTILEAASQIHVLDMIKSKQADVGIVDSSVFFNYRVAHDLEFSTLEVLDSLGPMPPYRIMIKRRNDVDLFDDLSYFLQEATDIKKFQDMLSLFNVSRFAYNCPDYYNDEQKSIETEWEFIMSDSEQPDKPKQKWASYKTLAEAVSSQEEKERSPPKEEDAPPETEDSAMQTSPGRTSETESEAVATSPKRERSQSEDESVSSKKRYKSPTMRRISTEFESKLTLEETSKAKDTSDERVCEKKEEAIPTTSTRRDKKSQADETLPKKKLRRSSPKRLGMEDLERLIYERNQEILRSLDESDSEDENPEEEKSEDKKDVEEEYEEEYEAEKDVKEEYEAEKDVEEEYEEEHDAEKDVEEEYEAEKDVEEEYEEGYEEELYKEKRRNLHKTLHQIWNFAEEPNYEQPHLVLATQNVGNDLPIGIFEIFASLIERVTERPVVLIHQRSPYRRIATELVDIAVMPPYENWRYGKLLPLSFVFEHALNKDNTPHVYADVIVSKNRSSSIRSIMDLRGCRCAMTRKRNPFSAAGLLLDELRSKGEDKSFFSTILKATSQIHVLDMIRNDEADVGIVDSAVFYNYRMEYGVRSLEVLDSLGPMPPYRIMIKKKRNKDLFDKLFTYIRESNEMEEVFDMLSSYFVSGFADNFDDYYCVEQELTETEEPAEAE